MISLVDLSLSGVHTFVNFLTVVGLNSQFFPLPSLNEKKMKQEPDKL